MIHATFDVSSTFDVEVIDVGKVSVLGGPQYKVCVYIDETPKYLFRIYLYDESDSFHEIKCSDRSVVVGCGQKVHVFDIYNKAVKSIKLKGYFGHLYSTDDLESHIFSESVLVASAMDIVCVSQVGEVLWQSPCLAVDGVVVSDIESGIVTGSGDYDPPDGWEDFRLDLKSGTII